MVRKNDHTESVAQLMNDMVVGDEGTSNSVL